MIDSFRPEDHLDPEQLVAYHEGRLAADHEERVQDHLAACRECAALLVDLEGLGDPDFGAAEPLPAGAGAQVWERVREEIRKDQPPPAANVAPFRPPEPAGSAPPRPSIPAWFRSLAAVLLLATLGLSAWVVQLRSRVDELTSPTSTAVVDLYPDTSTRGAGTPLVPPTAELITVILRDPRPPGRPAFDRYGVEILRQDGSEVWQDDGSGGAAGLTPIYGSFSLTLNRDRLGAGDFRLRLVGIGPEGARETVGEYALRIDDR